MLTHGRSPTRTSLTARSAGVVFASVHNVSQHDVLRRGLRDCSSDTECQTTPIQTTPPRDAVQPRAETLMPRTETTSPQRVVARAQSSLSAATVQNQRPTLRDTGKDSQHHGLSVLSVRAPAMVPFRPRGKQLCPAIRQTASIVPTQLSSSPAVPAASLSESSVGPMRTLSATATVEPFSPSFPSSPHHSLVAPVVRLRHQLVDTTTSGGQSSSRHPHVQQQQRILTPAFPPPTMSVLRCTIGVEKPATPENKTMATEAISSTASPHRQDQARTATQPFTTPSVDHGAPSDPGMSRLQRHHPVSLHSRPSTTQVVSLKDRSTVLESHRRLGILGRTTSDLDQHPEHQLSAGPLQGKRQQGCQPAGILATLASRRLVSSQTPKEHVRMCRTASECLVLDNDVASLRPCNNEPSQVGAGGEPLLQNSTGVTPYKNTTTEQSILHHPFRKATTQAPLPAHLIRTSSALAPANASPAFRTNFSKTKCPSQGPPYPETKPGVVGRHPLTSLPPLRRCYEEQQSGLPLTPTTELPASSGAILRHSNTTTPTDDGRSGVLGSPSLSSPSPSFLLRRAASFTSNTKVLQRRSFTRDDHVGEQPFTPMPSEAERQTQPTGTHGREAAALMENDVPLKELTPRQPHHQRLWPLSSQTSEHRIVFQDSETTVADTPRDKDSLTTQVPSRDESPTDHVPHDADTAHDDGHHDGSLEGQRRHRRETTAKLVRQVSCLEPKLLEVLRRVMAKEAPTPTRHAFDFERLAKAARLADARDAERSGAVEEVSTASTAGGRCLATRVKCSVSQGKDGSPQPSVLDNVALCKSSKLRGTARGIRNPHPAKTPTPCDEEKRLFIGSVISAASRQPMEQQKRTPYPRAETGRDECQAYGNALENSGDSATVSPLHRLIKSAAPPKVSASATLQPATQSANDGGLSAPPSSTQCYGLRRPCASLSRKPSGSSGTSCSTRLSGRCGNAPQPLWRKAVTSRQSKSVRSPSRRRQGMKRAVGATASLEELPPPRNVSIPPKPASCELLLLSTTKPRRQCGSSAPWDSSEHHFVTPDSPRSPTASSVVDSSSCPSEHQHHMELPVSVTSKLLADGKIVRRGVERRSSQQKKPNVGSSRSDHNSEASRERERRSYSSTTMTVELPLQGFSHSHPQAKRTAVLSTATYSGSLQKQSVNPTTPASYNSSTPVVSKLFPVYYSKTGTSATEWLQDKESGLCRAVASSASCPTRATWRSDMATSHPAVKSLRAGGDLTPLLPSRYQEQVPFQQLHSHVVVPRLGNSVSNNAQESSHLDTCALAAGTLTDTRVVPKKRLSFSPPTGLLPLQASTIHRRVTQPAGIKIKPPQWLSHSSPPEPSHNLLTTSALYATIQYSRSPPVLKPQKRDGAEPCDLARPTTTTTETTPAVMCVIDGQGIPTLQFRLPAAETVRRDAIDLKERVSKGTFGTVYRGLWNSMTIAVKVSTPQTPTHPTCEELLNVAREITAYRCLSHPAIVRYYGVCTDPSFTAVLTEYLPGGNLFDLLFEDRVPVSADQRRRMAIQLLEAVVCLHSHTPVLIHRDLKTANLVLDDAMNLKLCDFGKTLPMAGSSIVLEDNGGSPRYMAPECFHVGEHIDQKSDIWSVACCLIEIFGGPIPYEELLDNTSVVDWILGQQRPPTVPSWFFPPLRDILNKCFSWDPSYRPEAVEILQEVRALSPRLLERYKMNVRCRA